MIFLYPEGWTPPETPPVVVLSEAQRVALKDKIKQYVNGKGAPVLLKELVEYAAEWLRNVHSLHIHDQVIREVALVAREEMGYPGQEEPE